MPGRLTRPPAIEPCDINMMLFRAKDPVNGSVKNVKEVTYVTFPLEYNGSQQDLSLRELHVL